MLEYIAMGMVLHEALTGYDIKKEIEAGIGNFYSASHGSLYPALKKLTDKGYLTLTEQPYGNRIKKYYEATESGKAAFLEWLSSPFDPNSRSDSLLARIYFFGELPEDLRERQLREHELFYQQTLRRLQALEESLSVSDDIDYFEMSTLYLGLGYLQDCIRWLRHIRERKPLSAFLRDDFERKDES